eukprot:Rhum_TRINITY_DN22793_c0_g1::Rhum_TRINITY_DN22793_c0_g1_i1::g.175897::m.175897
MYPPLSFFWREEWRGEWWCQLGRNCGVRSLPLSPRCEHRRSRRSRASLPLALALRRLLGWGLLLLRRLPRPLRRRRCGALLGLTGDVVCRLLLRRRKAGQRRRRRRAAPPLRRLRRRLLRRRLARRPLRRRLLRRSGGGSGRGRVVERAEGVDVRRVCGALDVDVSRVGGGTGEQRRRLSRHVARDLLQLHGGRALHRLRRRRGGVGRLVRLRAPLAVDVFLDGGGQLANLFALDAALPPHVFPDALLRAKVVVVHVLVHRVRFALFDEAEDRLCHLELGEHAQPLHHVVQVRGDPLGHVAAARLRLRRRVAQRLGHVGAGVRGRAGCAAGEGVGGVGVAGCGVRLLLRLLVDEDVVRVGDAVHELAAEQHGVHNGEVG